MKNTSKNVLADARETTAIEYGLIEAGLALAIIPVATWAPAQRQIRLDQLFAALIAWVPPRASIATTISAATMFAAALSRIGSV